MASMDSSPSRTPSTQVEPRIVQNLNKSTATVPDLALGQLLCDYRSSSSYCVGMLDKGMICAQVRTK
jgi:hypothetical protein